MESQSQSQLSSQPRAQSQTRSPPMSQGLLLSNPDSDVIVVTQRNVSQQTFLDEPAGRTIPAEELDWTHRRTPRACILCRKKKVRCDGNQPPCSQCRAHKSQCIYVPRKTGAGSRRESARSRAARQTPPESQTLPYDNQNQPSPNNASVDGQSPSDHPAAGTYSMNQNQPSPNNTSLDGQNPSDQTAAGSYSMDHSDHISGLNAPDDVDFSAFWNNTPRVGHALDPDQGANSASSTDEMIRIMAPPASAIIIPETNDSQMLLEQSWFSGNYVGDSIMGEGGGNDVEDEENYATEAEEVTCSLQVAGDGFFKYMGPSVSFFPATTSGRDWITRVTGNKYFTKQMTGFLSIWKPEDLDWESMHYDATHLPDITDARIYVNGYFEGIQCLFPILDYNTFMQRFETTYKDFSAEKDPVWWALLNVVLAIGCRAVASKSSNLEALEDRISSLFQNSLARFPALVFGPSNLLRVQTFALMHVFSCFSSSPHIGYAVFSNAVRVAQAIGLHVTPSKSWGLSRHEIRQRKFVFWSLYCLDTDLAFRMGRPPLIQRQDIKLQRPRSFDLSDGSNSGPNNFSISSSYHLKLFNLNIDTAYLLVDAYQITNSTGTLAELQRKVDQIDRQVSSIFESLPPTWRLKDVVGTPEFTSLPGSVLMPLVHLHCCIFNAVWNIHFHLHILRSLPHLSAPLQQPWEVDTFPIDLHIAAEAASSTASIIQNLPSDDHACYWIFNSYVVFAFYILFHAVLECPNAPQSENYMGKMSGVIEHTVDGLFVHDTLISDKHLTHFLTFFSRTARMALRRAKDMKITDRQNTAYQVGESIGSLDLDGCNNIDFLMANSLPPDDMSFRLPLQV